MISYNDPQYPDKTLLYLLRITIGNKPRREHFPHGVVFVVTRLQSNILCLTRIDTKQSVHFGTLKIGPFLQRASFGALGGPGRLLVRDHYLS